VAAEGLPGRRRGPPELATPQPLEEVLPTLAATVAAAERRAIQAALEATGGDVTAASERLGIGRSTLFEKIRRLGLGRPAGGEPSG
jgi:transcriptional regulator of acetoin/glycerol metabolism